MRLLTIIKSKVKCDLRLWIPANLLGVLAVVVAFEFVSRCALPTEQTLFPCGIVNRIRFMEKEVIAQFAPPKILILGSSRPTNGIVPRIVDDSLSISNESSMNCSMLGAEIFDAYVLYRQNRSKLANAELTVFNVDDWWISRGGDHDTSQSIIGTFSERLHSDPPQATVKLLLDGVLTVRWRMPAFVNYRDQKLGFTVDANRQVTFPNMHDLPGGKYPPSYFERIADHYYRNFRISPSAKHWLKRLSNMIQADGGKFALIQMPNRDQLQNLVERKYPEEYKAQRAAWQETADELGVPIYFFPRPSDCGLIETDFNDAVHLRFTGSVKFTRFLCKLILREKLLSGLKANPNAQLAPPRLREWTKQRLVYPRFAEQHH